ncbi:MBL fold hydrolase [Oleiphilus sp. HI0132]|nr:MBL fold metallo-hydrolase [Oleiphilus sp. HI0132]KZZ80661.1 MBL fold hydrolase [Oleiphilus sp. HI0132]
MKILHHGAVNGVTGSCHELRISDKNSSEQQGILIDCGLFQGAETSGQSSESQLEIDFPVSHIKALVVTHVHIDHVGRIPYLLAAGFDGPIYCSEPSAVLLPLVLEDAVKIGFTRNKQMIRQFMSVLKQRIVPLKYGDLYSVFEGLDICLQPAGHILGSAYVECCVNQGKDAHTFIFSGDLGAPHSPLLAAPKPPEACDTLVIESTYGDKNHEDRRSRRQRLKAVIESAVQDRGVVLIPAFSIGRTQELLYELESLIYELKDKADQGALNWAELEVIVDSPLANDFTDTYRQLKPFWDAEAQSRVAVGRHPLSFENLLTIDDHQTHLDTVNYLAKTARPAIVIAASGMCAGGRIVNYLKALIEDKRTDILFVGYQAEGTAGRDIQTYGTRNGYVELEGKRYTINAAVHTISGYSAHAGQEDLLNFVQGMKAKPSEIRIVHGDDDAKKALKQALRELLGEEVGLSIP